jgi:hypothetical protein
MRRLSYCPKISFIFFSLLFAYISVIAQDTEVEEDYVKEFIYGLNINTNGGLIGGINFKWTTIVKPKHYRSLGLEIVGVKSPKEYRIDFNQTGNAFLFEKKNYLYSFRPQYGRDIIVFRKAPEEGIQITANFAAGPTLGLIVPYYVLYADDTQGNAIISIPYTSDVDFTRIVGVGNFLEGIGRMKVIPGVNAKVGLSLDFSAFRNNITGFEAGFTFEAFSEAPEILFKEFTKNKNVFTAAYLTIFLGSRK